MEKEVVFLPELVPQRQLERMARSVLQRAKEAFQDPEYVKKYEKWLSERVEKEGEEAVEWLG